jgi:hypothetical protein
MTIDAFRVTDGGGAHDDHQRSPILAKQSVPRLHQRAPDLY